MRNGCNSRGKHASEDHHLSIAIPPLPTLPTRPTLCQCNPMPGPSTMTQGRSGAPTTTTRCRCRNLPKKKERHVHSQCNRCINHQSCWRTEEEGPDSNGFDIGDDYDFNEVAYHNMHTWIVKCCWGQQCRGELVLQHGMDFHIMHTWYVGHVHFLCTYLVCHSPYAWFIWTTSFP